MPLEISLCAKKITVSAQAVGDKMLYALALVECKNPANIYGYW
jgi:hypothetical protein